MHKDHYLFIVFGCCLYALGIYSVFHLKAFTGYFFGGMLWGSLLMYAAYRHWKKYKKWQSDCEQEEKDKELFRQFLRDNCKNNK